MPRVYVRKFDWEEARRLHEEGLSYREIADRFGVTHQAVRRVCDPEYRERERARMESYKLTDTCDRCGAPKSKMSWYTNRSRFCRPCTALFAQTMIGDGVLCCRTCREWKPDEDFPFGRSTNPGRRGRHAQCRACNTIARQEYRERIKVPCVRCGRPCLPPSEKKTNGYHEPRCRECFYEARRK